MECSICVNNFYKYNCAWNCPHCMAHYCYPCIYKQINIQTTCPFCRYSLANTNVGDYFIDKHMMMRFDSNELYDTDTIIATQLQETYNDTNDDTYNDTYNDTCDDTYNNTCYDTYYDTYYDTCYDTCDTELIQNIYEHDANLVRQIYEHDANLVRQIYEHDANLVRQIYEHDAELVNQIYYNDKINTIQKYY